MKIRCISNKATQLPQEVLQNYIVGDKEFFIEEGTEYVVYALKMYLGYIWYCICDRVYTYYPRWYLSSLFEVSDKRLSRYWLIRVEEDDSGKNTPYFSFPEWANDPYFYGELIEEDSSDKNANTFRKYKELMDLEFPDNSITAIAQVGDKEWLICPICIDAWNCPNDQDGMVKCPKCGKIMHNPRYQERLKITI